MNVEVHAVDTSSWVVLNAQVDVLLGNITIQKLPTGGLPWTQLIQFFPLPRFLTLTSCCDSEAKAAISGEILLPKLVFLHLQSLLQDLLSLHKALVLTNDNDFCQVCSKSEIRIFLATEWPVFVRS